MDYSWPMMQHIFEVATIFICLQLLMSVKKLWWAITQLQHKAAASDDGTKWWFCWFIHLVGATNDRKHAVSPPNHIKLRPHFIYMSCLWWFNLSFICWLILLLMSPIKTCETSMPMLSNMGWMPNMFPWLPWTLTCCHESEATSSNMLLVVIQIISLRQFVIVMMNLWYCNCEANCNCDDELMIL
jgi:hypothetical protein